MSISPFFLNLRSSYQAEIDDLTFDSDGRDVLRQRLAEKRTEIGFLLQMMALSPEMVAVIFHQGFSFRRPTVMDHLLGQEADEFPQWSSVCDGIEMAPWAHELAQIVLQAPGGEWFMTVAAGLHYMAGKVEAAPFVANADDEFDDDDDGGEDEFDIAEDGDESDQSGQSGTARSRKEAGADWLVAQGFDRKD